MLTIRNETPWRRFVIAEQNENESPEDALIYAVSVDVNGHEHCAVVLTVWKNPLKKLAIGLGT